MVQMQLLYNSLSFDSSKFLEFHIKSSARVKTVVLLVCSAALHYILLGSTEVSELRIKEMINFHDVIIFLTLCKKMIKLW